MVLNVKHQSILNELEDEARMCVFNAESGREPDEDQIDKIKKIVKRHTEMKQKLNVNTTDREPAISTVRHEKENENEKRDKDGLFTLSSSHKQYLVPIHQKEVPPTLVNILPNYTITGLIGSGHWTNVYSGIDIIGNRVAIKTIGLGHSNSIDSNVIDKLYKNIEVWNELEHKNIIKKYHQDTIPVPHMVMELMEGGNLRSLMRNRRIGLNEAFNIALQLLEGLSYAHGMGLIHLNLTPENILFSLEGTAKIGDWGIERVGPEEAMTIQYHAPEQFAGDQYGDVDWRTDIYQMGMILYELLTGMNPFFDNDLIRIKGRVINNQPQPPSALNRDVPPELDDIIMRALEKRKEGRWRSADEMYHRLKELVQ